MTTLKGQTFTYCGAAVTNQTCLSHVVTSFKDVQVTYSIRVMSPANVLLIFVTGGCRFVSSLQTESEIINNNNSLHSSRVSKLSISRFAHRHMN